MPSHRYYDKYQRNQASKAFYNSAAWQKAREQALVRDNYLCQHCLKVKRITPADMVHHIVALLDDWSKSLDLDNLLSMCNPCHTKEELEIRKKKNKRKRRIRVIESKANREIT